MAVTVYRSIEDLEAAKDVEVGPSEWLQIDQGRIDGFADATGDHQWIHVDPDAARNGPFGTTVAHGFLTLSLLPQIVGSLRDVQNVRMTVNYGLNKVRFPAPVPVDSRIRGTAAIVAVDRIDAHSAQVVTRVTMEIEGGDKPACVAESVARVYFES